MIHMRREGEWCVFYAADQETEVWRVKPPAEGFTMADLELFMEHLKAEVQKRAVGPS